MLARTEPLAELIVRENGKPIAEARGEVVYAAEFLRWFSEEAVRVDGRLATAPGGANRIVVVHQPIGVALLVTPWNFPAAMATRKIGAGAGGRLRGGAQAGHRDAAHRARHRRHPRRGRACRPAW